MIFDWLPVIHDYFLLDKSDNKVKIRILPYPTFHLRQWRFPSAVSYRAPDL